MNLVLCITAAILSVSCVFLVVYQHHLGRQITDLQGDVNKLREELRALTDEVLPKD